MRFPVLSLAFAAGLAGALPAAAQNDIGDILSGVAQTLMTQQADKAAYVDAQSSNTANAYRRYLSQYPQGAYRANAEQALRALGASVDPVMDVPRTPNRANARRRCPSLPRRSQRTAPWLP